MHSKLYVTLLGNFTKHDCNRRVFGDCLRIRLDLIKILRLNFDISL